MALQPGTPSQVHGKAGHGEVRRAFGSDLLNVQNDVGTLWWTNTAIENGHL